MTAQSKAEVRQGIVSASLRMLAGPIAWAAHLTTVYGFQSLACTVSGGSPALSFGGYDFVQIAILAITIAIIALLAAALVIARATVRGNDNQLARFQWRVGLYLGFISAFGILGQGGVALVLPSCPALR